MPKFFLKLKKQRSKTADSEQLQSSPVTSSVGTQSEPLSASFHLDGLLNSSGGREEGGREEGGAQEEVDGAAIFSHQSSLEERGRRVWPSQPLHLPPPLIPSSPLTLSRSPTPHNHSHPLTAEQLEATPTRSTPSPTFLPVASAPTNTFTLYSPASDRSVQVSSAGRSTHPARPAVQGSNEEEEVHHCRAALEALEQKEMTLMAEVAELRGSHTNQHHPTSPHPESVVAELEESLRQAEETVHAVQGERDGLREGVDRMRDELISLKRSNSLLARRKQQWMEVASQTRVVLEENRGLVTQNKTQQLLIADLQSQYHSRVGELERRVGEADEAKMAAKLQLKQVMEGQSILSHLISNFLGVSVGGANLPLNSESVQHVASLLERYECEQRRELTAWQEQVTILEREKQVLVVRVEEAKSVARRLESELREVQNVVREGEESVARLRGQLEEVQEREEATQLQLAHAIAQVDKAMTERDSYSRIARRWQAVQRNEGETARALDNAHHQLQVQATEHRAHRKRYKTEIHRLRSLQESSVRRQKISKDKPQRDSN